MNCTRVVHCQCYSTAASVPGLYIDANSSVETGKKTEGASRKEEECEK